VALGLPVLLLVPVIVGTWTRKRMDQRFGPRARRRDMLLDLKQAASQAHPDRPDEVVFRDFQPRARSLYRFPDPFDGDGLLTQAAALNCAAFASSTFADSLAAKLRRNGSHQRRNPFVIMLMAHEKPAGPDDAAREAFVGFTHLIPITEGTYNEYIAGKIGDNDFNADLVCRPDEEAYAIIVFSLGLDRWRLKEIIQGRRLNAFDGFLAGIGVPPFWVGDMYDAERRLWAGFVHHARQLMENQRFAGLPVTFLAQSFNLKVERVLKEVGFVQLPGLSADKEYLFELKVWPPAKRFRP
jgi:hypothetical protein